MVRPQKHRTVKFKPDVTYFKPRGIPMMDLEEVVITIDEQEAIRLADYVGLSHEAAGKQMGVSRATFGRILQKARHTLAEALFNGKAIRVEGGRYRMDKSPYQLRCQKCDHKWEAPELKPKSFPVCPICETRQPQLEADGK